MRSNINENLIGMQNETRMENKWNALRLIFGSLSLEG